VQATEGVAKSRGWFSEICRPENHIAAPHMKEILKSLVRRLLKLQVRERSSDISRFSDVSAVDTAHSHGAVLTHATCNTHVKDADARAIAHDVAGSTHRAVAAIPPLFTATGAAGKKNQSPPPPLQSDDDCSSDGVVVGRGGVRHDTTNEHARGGRGARGSGGGFGGGGGGDEGEREVPGGVGGVPGGRGTDEANRKMFDKLVAIARHQQHVLKVSCLCPCVGLCLSLSLHLFSYLYLHLFLWLGQFKFVFYICGLTPTHDDGYTASRSLDRRS
jgi:hypothetical protein